MPRTEVVANEKMEDDETAKVTNSGCWSARRTLLAFTVRGQAIAGKKLFISARLVEFPHEPADLASVGS